LRETTKDNKKKKREEAALPKSRGGGVRGKRRGKGNRDRNLKNAKAKIGPPA